MIHYEMKNLLCVVALFFSVSVNAALIDHGSHVHDTTSGLDWLKLDATIGRTYSQVTGELSSGGFFEGWQYATGSEWENLLFGQGFGAMSCGDGRNFCGMVTTDSGDAALKLMNLIGRVPSFSSHYPYANSLGMLADIDGDSGEHWVTQLFVDDFNGFRTAWATTFFTTKTHEPVVGSWLVRPASVSEPAMFSLFVLGFAGLWSVRRQVKKSV